MAFIINARFASWVFALGQYNFILYHVWTSRNTTSDTVQQICITNDFKELIWKAMHVVPHSGHLSITKTLLKHQIMCNNLMYVHKQIRASKLKYPYNRWVSGKILPGQMPAGQIPHGQIPY